VSEACAADPGHGPHAALHRGAPRAWRPAQLHFPPHARPLPRSPPPPAPMSHLVKLSRSSDTVCVPRSNGSKGLHPAEQWLQGSASRGAMAPRVCVPRSNGSKGLRPAEQWLQGSASRGVPTLYDTRRLAAPPLSPPLFPRPLCRHPLRSPPSLPFPIRVPLPYVFPCGRDGRWSAPPSCSRTARAP